MAELVDALVSNTCGKPCRFDSGSGYEVLLNRGAFSFWVGVKLFCLSVPEIFMFFYYSLNPVKNSSNDTFIAFKILISVFNWMLAPASYLPY